MERHFIRETGANNPAVGYNLTPRWSEPEVLGTRSQTIARPPKLTTQQVRDAGQYFVAAEISHQGGYAVLTPGNRQDIDVIANDVDHKRFIGAQVKTKTGRNWQVSNVLLYGPREKPLEETRFWVLVDLSTGLPGYYSAGATQIPSES